MPPKVVTAEDPVRGWICHRKDFFRIKFEAVRPSAFINVTRAVLVHVADLTSTFLAQLTPDAKACLSVGYGNKGAGELKLLARVPDLQELEFTAWDAPSTNAFQPLLQALTTKQHYRARERNRIVITNGSNPMVFIETCRRNQEVTSPPPGFYFIAQVNGQPLSISGMW